MPPGHDCREWEFDQGSDLSIKRYFHGLSELIPQLPYSAINSIVSIFLDAFAEQRTVYVFGNGGSAASASHMMCDINKGAGGL
ncbi:MAG: SIS domain-containing protein, partial [Candidatus Angelobacter sp.]